MASPGAPGGELPGASEGVDLEGVALPVDVAGTVELLVGEAPEVLVGLVLELSQGVLPEPFALLVVEGLDVVEGPELGLVLHDAFQDDPGLLKDPPVGLDAPLDLP